MKNTITFFLLTVGVLVCALIIGGEVAEDSLNDRRPEVVDDYYGTLGVARDADQGEIKRAYKTLAKRWHPDKNPNCTSCRETFTKIADAYETLFDVKKRAAYDETGGVASSELKSARSVPLNRDNFDQLVTYSNDVWMVLIFKPDDPSCAQFHPFWEHQIQKHGNLVRFGRVDISKGDDKWLPVKVRVLPMLLKYGRHLSMPEIFPITAMHETRDTLMKFVLTSFPLVGLPVHLDSYGLKSWVSSASRKHKVLFLIPGKSEEERYKSHLMPRKVAAQWAELFEFRTAETSLIAKLPEDALPASIRSALPPESEMGNHAMVMFFEASGDPNPKAAVKLEWQMDDDELALTLTDFAQRAAPALTARSAELLCRSLAVRRVYCLVLVDKTDAEVAKAVAQVKESKVAYQKEVADIRENGGEMSEDEDNFDVLVVRLFASQKSVQPSLETCLAPKWSDVEKALSDSVGLETVERPQAFLMDMDQGRIAALRGMTSFSNIYPTISYEESLKWVDEALHPYLSFPDCDEGVKQNLYRSLRIAPILELIVQLLTFVFIAEAIAKALVERSVRWAAGALGLTLLVLVRLPPFLRAAGGYVPAVLLAPTLPVH